MRKTFFVLNLLFTSCIITFTSSCDKEKDDNPKGYLTMNVNGDEWVSNPTNSDVSATITLVDDMYVAHIRAKKNNFFGKPSEISIKFRRNQPITEQQYNLTEFNGGLYDIVLYEQGGKVYQAAASDGASVPQMGSATVTIEKIVGYPNSSNAKYFKGTFNAQVVRNGITFNITGGKFQDYRVN